MSNEGKAGGYTLEKNNDKSSNREWNFHTNLPIPVSPIFCVAAATGGLAKVDINVLARVRRGHARTRFRIFGLSLVSARLDNDGVGDAATATTRARKKLMHAPRI